MVFYASSFPHNATHVYRYTIVAASVEAVDEWYRLTKDAGDDIHRIAPDYYTHPHANYPWRKLETSKEQHLKEQLRFTLNNDREGVYRGEYSWPGQHAPDHTSGKASYIRSKSDPSIYWYDNDGFIVPSKTERTKFRVTGRSRPEKDHVIVRSDHITISVLEKDNGHVRNVRNDNGILTTGGGGSDIFLFNDFKSSFLSSGTKEDAVIRKVEFDGDEWELAA